MAAQLTVDGEKPSEPVVADGEKPSEPVVADGGNHGAAVSDLTVAGDGGRESTQGITNNETCTNTPLSTSTMGQLSLPAYSAFEKNERMLITLLVGFATITSPLTATVYFPLFPLLKSQFNITSQQVNMTLTIYIVFQALSPAVFGPLSDAVGRRPIYLVTLAIYALANLGMALNKSNYAILLLFPAFQSLGASAAFAISYGIVADICVPSERGKTMGAVSMLLNLGTCIGPILGGLVAYLRGDCQWIFWALLIVGAILFLFVGMFLPETARSLVGDGSGKSPNPMWHGSWWAIMKQHSWNVEKDQISPDRVERRIGHKLSLRRFVAPIRIIFYMDAFLCLWLHGSYYAVDYTVAAAVPDIYKNIYKFNELHIDLSYLPRGVGIIFGGYVNGKLMDHNYKVVARKHNWIINRVAGDDLTKFPIELARSRGSLCFSSYRRPHWVDMAGLWSGRGILLSYLLFSLYKGFGEHACIRSTTPCWLIHFHRVLVQQQQRGALSDV